MVELRDLTAIPPEKDAPIQTPTERAIFAKMSTPSVMAARLMATPSIRDVAGSVIAARLRVTPSIKDVAGSAMAARLRAAPSIKDVAGSAMAARLRAAPSTRDVIRSAMAARFRATPSIRDVIGSAMAAQLRAAPSTRDVIRSAMAAQLTAAPSIRDMINEVTLPPLVERFPVFPHYPFSEDEEGVQPEYEVTVQETRSLELGLLELEPDLLNLLQGARVALKTPNPDRPRHVLVSLRELVTQVLHLLAPDDSIRSWTNDSSLYHNGRPTRRARLLYIYREIYTGALSKFVDTRVDLALILMDALNAETHAIPPRLTEQELRVLVVETESLLYSILGEFLINQARTTLPM